MKRFAALFAAVLIAVESFLFFGGYYLFDFRNHPYRTGAAAALIIAVIIQAFVIQDEKIRQLEDRLKTLEESKNE